MFHYGEYDSKKNAARDHILAKKRMDISRKKRRMSTAYRKSEGPYAVKKGPGVAPASQGRQGAHSYQPHGGVQNSGRVQYPASANRYATKEHSSF